jgi:hypothetical protein
MNKYVGDGPTAAARDRLHSLNHETLTEQRKGRSPLAEISGTPL